jgi:hypothetical protein
MLDYPGPRLIDTLIGKNFKFVTNPADLEDDFYQLARNTALDITNSSAGQARADRLATIYDNVAAPYYADIDTIVFSSPTTGPSAFPLTVKLSESSTWNFDTLVSDPDSGLYVMTFGSNKVSSDSSTKVSDVQDYFEEIVDSGFETLNGVTFNTNPDVGDPDRLKNQLDDSFLEYDWKVCFSYSSSGVWVPEVPDPSYSSLPGPRQVISIRHRKNYVIGSLFVAGLWDVVGVRKGLMPTIELRSGLDESGNLADRFTFDGQFSAPFSAPLGVLVPPDDFWNQSVIQGRVYYTSSDPSVAKVISDTRDTIQIVGPGKAVISAKSLPFSHLGSEFFAAVPLHMTLTVHHLDISTQPTNQQNTPQQFCVENPGNLRLQLQTSDDNVNWYSVFPGEIKYIREDSQKMEVFDPYIPWQTTRKFFRVLGKSAK